MPSSMLPYTHMPSHAPERVADQNDERGWNLKGPSAGNNTSTVMTTARPVRTTIVSSSKALHSLSASVTHQGVTQDCPIQQQGKGGNPNLHLRGIVDRLSNHSQGRGGVDLTRYCQIQLWAEGTIQNAWRARAWHYALKVLYQTTKTAIPFSMLPYTRMPSLAPERVADQNDERGWNLKAKRQRQKDA